MSLSSKIKAIHVRERMLIVSLVIIAPILVAGGVLAFVYERDTAEHEQVIDLKAIGKYFSDSPTAAPSTLSAGTAASGTTQAQ